MDVMRKVSVIITLFLCYHSITGAAVGQAVSAVQPDASGIQSNRDADVVNANQPAPAANTSDVRKPDKLSPVTDEKKGDEAEKPAAANGPSSEGGQTDKGHDDVGGKETVNVGEPKPANTGGTPDKSPSVTEEKKGDEAEKPAAAKGPSSEGGQTDKSHAGGGGEVTVNVGEPKPANTGGDGTPDKSPSVTEEKKGEEAEKPAASSEDGQPDKGHDDDVEEEEEGLGDKQADSQIAKAKDTVASVEDQTVKGHEDGDVAQPEKGVAKKGVEEVEDRKYETESSHFFAYLVCAALLVALLYIGYHNKRKVLLVSNSMESIPTLRKL
ncbi:unnamed protein product [Merluccius merluccius]